MPCPYCNSWNWERHHRAFKMEEESEGIWAYYPCECLKCGKEFVTRQWFERDGDIYECMTEEEYRESE